VSFQGQFISTPLWTRAGRVGILAISSSVVALAASGTIYTFKNKPAGIFPLGPLTADAQGNFYGTAFNGGIAPRPNNDCSQTENGCGVVFKLTPSGAGEWAYSVIYEFKGAPSDGQDPTDTLAIDADGNIYGTTYYGGNPGTVYELSPLGNGSYSERVIHKFTGNAPGSADGTLPTGLIVDSTGILYGTAVNGGTFNQGGVVWELSPNGDGSFTERILHNFTGPPDGEAPRGQLLLDASGTLFGTTSYGGTYGGGTAYELSPSSGGWTETVLHSFGSSGDGCNPFASLVSDGAGNLYSTTSGCASFGTVFELSPSGGAYTEKIIHYFLNMSAGEYPGPVVFDSAANLYGTTSQGGEFGFGTIFKLTPNGNGGWAESAVHNFTGNGDGAYPMYGVTIGSDGNVYGTTPYGGSAATYDGFGVVFRYKP
jgi:uncharacterized repeat protein (TIGR03803 family)